MHKHLMIASAMLAACSRHSMGIGYDPVGSWAPLDEETWPRQEDFGFDTRACTDEILTLMRESTVTVSGTFPKWKAARREATLTVGDLEIEGVLHNDISAGSGFRTEDEDFVFPDGSVLLWADFYTDRTMRIGTDFPGKNYCWNWFEQE